MRFLDGDVILQFLVREIVIAFEMQLVNLMLAPFVNVIYDMNGVRVLVELGVYFDVEIAFRLEVRDEIAAAFLHQLLVDKIFVIYRNQSFERALPYMSAVYADGN